MVVAQSAGTILQVGLEMKNRVGVFLVARPGNLAQLLRDRIPFAQYQAGQNRLVQLLIKRELAGQEAAVEAFATVGPQLPPRLARMAAYFRAQEQEHIDAVLKAMRGLKGTAEPSEEVIEVWEARSDRERLVFLYEVESATIDEVLSAIAELEASWPRSLLSSTVANQAQHLTLLRQALGAVPAASVPFPFENGTAAPPE